MSERYLYHHRTQGKNVEGVHVRNICRALVRHGDTVRLVSVTHSNDSFDRESESASSVNTPSEGRTALRNWLTRLARRVPEPIFEIIEISYNVVSFFRLFWICKQHKPTRLYERYALFLFSSLLLAKLFRIPVVYEINDSALIERLRPLFFRRIARFIERQVFTRADGLVFVSTRFKEIVEAQYGPLKKSIISPNAIDPNIFRYDPATGNSSRELAKHELQLTDRTVCGFAGCFAPWHGVDRLLQQLGPCLDRNPELVFLLIGDGETLPLIRSLILRNNWQSRIITTGTVPHAKMIGYIRSMDFAVLPNSNEYGSPMKLFEFMACGVPMVAAAVPPVVEIVENDIDGLLFPRDDLSQCIVQIERMVTQPIKRAQLANAASTKIARQHCWDNNAANLIQLFNKNPNYSAFTI